MGEKFKIFDVEITVSKTVRVKVPLDEKITNGDPLREVAEEFALGGKAAWPEWVLSEDEEFEVDGVREVEAVPI
jgi:hypothetical protein